MRLKEDAHPDIITVAAACHAIAREATVVGLCATVIRLAVEDSGALTGYLLLAEKGELQVTATAVADRERVRVQMESFVPSPTVLPLAAVDFARGSKQKVVIDDTSRPHLFSEDDYFSRKKGGSFACIPIVRDDSTLGVLYLENDRAAGAFDEDRILILEIIAAQSAVALENIYSTERLKGLLDAAPDAMVIVDSDEAIVIVNAQTEHLFGYSREELLGKSMLILMPRRYRDDHTSHVGRYKSAPRYRAMGENGEQLYALRKDGSEFPVDISLSPFYLDDKLLITAAIRDVTERVRADEELKLAEAKYRGIFENSVDGIFYASPQRHLIDVNPALAAMLGYESPAELLAACGDLLHTIEETKKTCTLASVLQDGGHMERFEALISRKNGEVISIVVQVRGVHDETGKLLHHVGVVEDITERKKAEEALRFSEARYRTLYRENPTMIFTVDSSMTIVSANPASARQLGYAVEDMEGQKISFFFHHEDRADIVSQIERCIANPGQVYTWQFRKLCRSGRTLWVEELGQATYDLNGTINVLIVCLDITERLTAERALKESELKYKQLAETLELRVKETVAELRQKDKMLIVQSRQAVMGEMISNIAHQWRQPLNTLGLLAQEMHYYYAPEKGTKEGADVNFHKTMEIINHMSKTIDDFRNFFRPEKEKVYFRVSESIEKALNLLEGSLKVSLIKVEVNKASDPEVEGFPNEFSQVLMNILINARDAFASVRVPDPTITIDVFEEGGKAVVTITDNAGGIPGWVLEKIFEPYFTTKGPDKGTGVGLFMCKTIVEKSMNGTLSARNVEGGAQFRIEF
ncbi:PAS domain S-box protein [Geomonas sp. RF6]|uniref:PAS domain S-box protein n=1 Tax=Geomonas sp. RF6 TaxID=2897342 RepID=UPI001E4FA6ED|nr:PAS domain S-box protein [Geomonas sp. RF6]UFS70150.1 PAS domain S-box protein [Geomonas sp. RF6]